jgi:hypothetical protein
MLSVEMVTCSYAPDYELCKMLCESIDKYVVPSIGHTIVVDKRDQQLFANLSNTRTKIVTVEDVLPWFFWQFPLYQKIWLTPVSFPVRGWVLQQIIKLSAPCYTNKDVILLVDSDTYFVRQFTESHVLSNDKIKFYHDPSCDMLAPTMYKHRMWHKTAARLLGMPLPEKLYFDVDYVGSLIIWHRDTIVKLQNRISEVTGNDWQTSVARSWNFSEYILYGIYAHQYLNDSVHHEFITHSLCHSCWTAKDIDTDDKLSLYVRSIKEYHVMAHIQSKNEISILQRRAIYESIKSRIEEIQ